MEYVRIPACARSVLPSGSRLYLDAFRITDYGRVVAFLFGMTFFFSMKNSMFILTANSKSISYSTPVPSLVSTLLSAIGQFDDLLSSFFEVVICVQFETGLRNNSLPLLLIRASDAYHDRNLHI